MKHDEITEKHTDLLVKIKIAYGFNYYYELWKALESVTKLHSPIIDNYHAYKGEDACAICNSAWPCQTIETIQKKLILKAVK